MYGEPDFETVEDEDTDLNPNHVTATFRGAAVELTAQDDARREQSVYLDGATLLDLADAYRAEKGDPRPRCAECGDLLGGRVGDYCSTRCVLAAKAERAQDEQDAQDGAQDGGDGE